MTREEAIKIIKDCKEKSFKRTFYTVNEYHAALDMAIEALENENAVIDRVLGVLDKYIDRRIELMNSYKEREVHCLAEEERTRMSVACYIRSMVETLKGRWEWD